MELLVGSTWPDGVCHARMGQDQYRTGVTFRLEQFSGSSPLDLPPPKLVQKLGSRSTHRGIPWVPSTGKIRHIATIVRA